jgi:thiol-disulfide isomerase/thioredoxin
MKTIKTLLLLIAPVYFIQAQDATAILEKYFQAVGGKNAIENVQSVSAKYKLINCTGKKDTSVIFTSRKLPHFQFDQTFISGRKSVSHEFYADEAGTLHKFYYPYPMDKGGDKRSTTLSLPHLLLKAVTEKKVKDAKPEIIDGKKYLAIRTTFKESLSHENGIYYFDEVTGVLVASSRDNLDGDITYYLDNRTINGLVVSFKQDYYMNKSLITKTVYEKMEFNVELANELFTALPKGRPQREVFSKFNKIEFVDRQTTERDFQGFIKSFPGKLIMIDIWATWCGPCKFEFNSYDSSFYQLLADNQVEMVFLTIDTEDKEKTWKEDIAHFNINGYHALAGKTLTRSLHKDIFQNGPIIIPHYILIDENGKVLSRDMTRPSSKKFKTDLTTLLQTQN